MIHSPLILNFLGFQELVLVFFVVMFLFGPKKIPELARSLGKGLRKVNEAKNSITQEIKKGMQEGEGQGKDVLTEIKSVKDDIDNIKENVQKNISEIQNSIPRK
jgi:TatA/E family protein of Tat protein translocase